MTNLENFIVKQSSTFLEALRLIDQNQKGFVLVVDKDKRVVGTLTDGDIRRALIAGSVLEDSLTPNQNFTSVGSSVKLEDMIEIFKDRRIDFLPILDADEILLGIITRKQLYVLLLQCRDLPNFDELLNVDESLMDFEIFKRPWGIYKTTVLQDKYQSKVMQVKPGARLSLQYHEHREEYWVIASGIGIAQIGDSFVPVNQGSVVFIPKGVKHRITNTSDTDQLIIGETQIGDYFGEDDIVRIEDDYNRV